jgi:chromosome segregation ATPase
MLSKSLTKAEKGLEKIGLEKERLIIEKTKLEGQIHSFLNPEWNKGNQDVLSRAQELEEKVGKFNSIRTESEIHARMTELEKDNEKLRKVIEVQKEDMKRQAAEREDSLAAIDEGAAEIKFLKAELEKKEPDPAMAEVIEKGAAEIKFLKAELEKKKVDPAMAEAVEKGAAEIKFLKAELEKKKPDPAMAEAIEKGAAEIEFLKAELEKKNSDLAILEGRYKELEMSAQQEESKNIAANEKISEQEAEIEELCEQNETNEKITEELRYQITSLKNTSTNMKHTLEAKFASCEKDRIELSTKVDKLTAENQTYQNEIESLRKEHKKYLEQCNEVKILLDQSSNRTNELKSQVGLIMSTFSTQRL